ncbi:MAG: efflux RND transporter periplasmic adaptor subunit [Paracoccaceae bacterium]
MRLIPVLTAVLVMAILYLVVMERDALMSFARGQGLDVAALIDGPEGQADPASSQETDSAPDADADAAGEDQADADRDEAGREEADGVEGPQPIAVVARRSAAREIDSAVILRGETQAARQVEMRAETSGQVISEPLRKGAFVQEGDTLCRLDPGAREAAAEEARARLQEAEARVPEVEARLEEARARLEEAELNANAANRLSEGGFASQTRVASAKAAVRSAEAGVQAAHSQLESVQAGIRSAQAAVDSAETELRRLVIRAPFGGVLESDTAELGSLMQPGALCATVIQLDPVRLVGFVPETEVDRIAPDARAGARLISGREVTGRVSFLSRASDPTTRTFRVEVTVPNPDLALRDGQTAEILIEAEGARAHLLPQSALTLDDDGTLGVRVVAQDSTAKFLPVTLLRDTVEGVWVSGLPEAVDVIVLGQEYVTDGVPVTASFREEATQ